MRLGTLSNIWLTTAIAAVMTAAAGPLLVMVETQIPMLATPELTAIMKLPVAMSRAIVPPTENVVPERLGSGPRPNATPPAITPTTTVDAINAATSVIAAKYLASTKRTLGTGLTRSDTSVPAWASPAMASPAQERPKREHSCRFW